MKSHGSKYRNKELGWDNKIIVDATINSYFDMDVYKINYGYSFYHNEKVELMLTAGLHITTLDLGISAVGTIDGVAGETYASGAGITVPLPVIGFKGEYTIIKNRLFIEYKTDYFALKYDDIKGNLISSAINLEYRFVDHVGIGLGYNANKIYVSAEDEDKKFEVENNLSGAMLYLTYIY